MHTWARHNHNHPILTGDAIWQKDWLWILCAQVRDRKEWKRLKRRTFHSWNNYWTLNRFKCQPYPADSSGHVWHLKLKSGMVSSQFTVNALVVTLQQCLQFYKIHNVYTSPLTQYTHSHLRNSHSTYTVTMGAMVHRFTVQYIHISFDGNSRI